MPKLKNCLQTYLQIDRSKHTNKSYQTCLTRLVDAIGPERDIKRISFDDLADYSADMRGDVKQSTFHQYIRIIKTFFQWCQKTGYIKESPASGLRAMKPARDPSRSRAIPASDLKKMQRVVQSNPRNYAIFLFLADTGCRVGGLTSLTLKRLELDKQTAVLLEKGGKWHRVFFGEETAQALRDWLVLRPTVDHDYVWTGTDGKPMKRESLAAMITRLAKKATGKVYGPHAIRHSVGHAMAKRVPVTVTQKKLGHADPRVTMDIYYPNDDAYLKEMSQRHALAALSDDRGEEKKQPEKVIQIPLRKLSRS